MRKGSMSVDVTSTAILPTVMYLSTLPFASFGVLGPVENRTSTPDKEDSFGA